MFAMFYEALRASTNRQLNHSFRLGNKDTSGHWRGDLSVSDELVFLNIKISYVFMNYVYITEKFLGDLRSLGAHHY